MMGEALKIELPDLGLVIEKLDALNARLDRMEAKDERLLNTEEAANLLGVTPETIRRRVRAGEYKATRKGSKMMFRREDVV